MPAKPITGSTPSQRRIAARHHARLEHRLVAQPRSSWRAAQPCRHRRSASSASARGICLSSGARKGPAGITSPLPSPTLASTTIRLKSLASCGFWKPSSMTMTVASVPSISLAPAARSAETTVGACASSSSVSSPISAALWPSVDEHRALRLAAIAAREEAGPLARFLQDFGDGDRRRRLAAAARGEIADADHRKARAVGR